MHSVARFTLSVMFSGPHCFLAAVALYPEALYAANRVDSLSLTDRANESSCFSSDLVRLGVTLVL